MTQSQNVHTVHVRFLNGANSTYYSYLTHLYLNPGDHVVVNSPVSGFTVVEVMQVYNNTRGMGATKWVLGTADLSVYYQAEQDRRKEALRAQEVAKLKRTLTNAKRKLKQDLDKRADEVLQEILTERLKADPAVAAMQSTVTDIENQLSKLERGEDPGDITVTLVI